MSTLVHRIYIWSMVLITVMVTVYLAMKGADYYSVPLEERYYHEDYDLLKPAGIYGHGLGILGTFMILFGVTIYIARKRYNFLSQFIRLKYLLEFHIFLCFLGSILILFHTSFKFGGIVSIAFWCMVAVVLSGIIGRYIYIQIPRTIEGREMSLNEVINLRESLKNMHSDDKGEYDHVRALINKASQLKAGNPFHYIKTKIILNNVANKLDKIIPDYQKKTTEIAAIKQEIQLAQRIERLQQMQKLFKYWHVAHMPFALIMLVIVLIHVIVTLALGYYWIF